MFEAVELDPPGDVGHAWLVVPRVPGKDEGLWLDDRWRLSRITNAGVPLVLMLHPRDHYDLADLLDGLGLLTTHIARHIQALPHILRRPPAGMPDASLCNSNGKNSSRNGAGQR